MLSILGSSSMFVNCTTFTNAILSLIRRGPASLGCASSIAAGNNINERVITAVPIIVMISSNPVRNPPL